MDPLNLFGVAADKHIGSIKKFSNVSSQVFFEHKLTAWMELIELPNIENLIVKQHKLLIFVENLAAELLNTELLFSWLDLNYSQTILLIELKDAFNPKDNYCEYCSIYYCPIVILSVRRKKILVCCKPRTVCYKSNYNHNPAKPFVEFPNLCLLFSMVLPLGCFFTIT